jgi:hypothetical protein
MTSPAGFMEVMPIVNGVVVVFSCNGMVGQCVGETANAHGVIP